MTDYKLLADLEQVKLRFRSTVDTKSPLMQEIDGRLRGFTENRVAQANKLRRAAKLLSNDYERIMKLLEALEYDAQTQAQTEIDTLTARYCGRINKEQTLSRHRENLRRILARSLP